MIKSTSLVLLLISLISVCQGLYFHIAETERKCFIEEIPDETTVIGKYRDNHCGSSYLTIKFLSKLSKL